MSYATVPGTTTRLLSVVKKMPCLAWNLPPLVSCPFAVLTDADHICRHCYARKGRFVFPDVQRAMARRWEWTVWSMREEDRWADWVVHLTRAIRQESPTDYFRGHGAGDFFSPTYVKAWIEVAGALPHIQFWFPSRSWRAPWVAALFTLNGLQNVAVRPSALRFEEDPPVIEGLAAGSGARRHGYTCPAPGQGGRCVDCRICWEKKEQTVFYHIS
jgi:hypothetical protein